jgi:hypothetical protein
MIGYIVSALQIESLRPYWRKLLDAENPPCGVCDLSIAVARLCTDLLSSQCARLELLKTTISSWHNPTLVQN